MALVGIVMGSDSDMPVMAKAADILDKLGVSYEMTIISAHREPDVFFEYAKTAEEMAEEEKQKQRRAKNREKVARCMERKKLKDAQEKEDAAHENDSAV